MSKPIAKSLHTVTVLVRVAKFVQSGKLCTNEQAVNAAVAMLGLAGHVIW